MKKVLRSVQLLFAPAVPKFTNASKILVVGGSVASRGKNIAHKQINAKIVIRMN